MAGRQSYYTSEEAQRNATDSASRMRRTNIELVRVDNRPFESPRGRGHNNPAWGRADGMPFVSPRGRGRRIPLQGRSQDPNTAGDGSYEAEEQENQRQVFTAPDGRRYHSGLVRLDERPFESPRGRGHNNPGWGRVGGRPFVSQRGQIAHQMRSADSHIPSAPTYEDVMDDYE